MNKIYLISSLVLGVAAAMPVVDSTRPTPSASDTTITSRAYLGSRNLPGHGVAIDGYSPVSYFEGKAERGSALFAVEHDGVTYHLTNSVQVETFRRNPAKFVPAYGGWCAFGMAIEDKFPIDPTCFEIVDGRLMLFLRNGGIDALQLWRDGNERELLTKAERHWKTVRG